MLSLLPMVSACTALSSGSEVVSFGDAMQVEDDAGPCPTGGQGSLAVTIEIPDDLEGDVTVTEAGSLRQLTGSDEFGLDAGEHLVVARRVTAKGEVVGRAYSAVEDRQTVCVRDGTRSEVSVRYALEPGSKKLWTTGGSTTFHTASYALEDLAKSGAPDPATTIAGAVNSSTAMAFDSKGNLWLSDVTGKVHAYTQDTLGSPRNSSLADVLLEGPTLCASTMPCGPQALAFDSQGDLWVALPDSVVRIAAVELVGRNEPPIATRLSGKSINKPRSLAFDAQGALWIGNGGDSSVVMFDESRLAVDDNQVADATLLGQVKGPVFSGLSSPTAMAFDESGNLWVGYLAPNVVVRFTPEDQQKDGPVTPSIQIGVDAVAIVKGMAFDDGGNLWLTGQGVVSRVAAEDLATGSLAQALIKITLDGFVEDIAFDPPAASTPLAR